MTDTNIQQNKEAVKSENCPPRNIEDFIYEYQKRNPHGQYFNKRTLKFFGERISDMRLIKGTFKKIAYDGNEHTCYAISSLQRKHPNDACRVWTFFDVKTLCKVVLNA